MHIIHTETAKENAMPLLLKIIAKNQPEYSVYCHKEISSGAQVACWRVKQFS